MLYINNNKIYLKVSEKFIEVQVKKDKKDEYTVIPNEKNIIEVYGNEDKFVPISLEEAYKSSNKSKLSLDDEK